MAVLPLAIVRVPSPAGNRRLRGAAPRTWLLRGGSEPAYSWNGQKGESSDLGNGGRNLAASPDRKEGGKSRLGVGKRHGEEEGPRCLDVQRPTLEWAAESCLQ